MFIQCQRPLPPIGTPAEIALMPEDRWRRVSLLLRVAVVIRRPSECATVSTGSISKKGTVLEKE